MGITALLISPVLLLGETWTLDKALEYSVRSHPDALIARAKVLEAEAMTSGGRAAKNPQLGLRVSYLQTNNPMQGFGMILSQGSFDNSIDFNDPGQLDSLNGTLEGRYRLYSGGGIDAGIRSGEANERASEFGEESVHQIIQDGVVQAYFGIRQADQVVHSLEAGIRVLEENLRVSVIREEAGQLIRTERLNLEVELAALRRELLARQHEAKLARSQLAYLLGQISGSEIELPDDDASISRITMPVSLGIENRPELQAARAGLEAAEHASRVARSGKLPTVDAFANIQADKGWRRDGDGSSWTAGLVLNVPIFDGHSTRAKTSLAEARKRMASEQVRRIQLSLGIELERAQLAHELALAQKQVAEQQVEQANEAAALSRDRFAAGTLLSTELIGVESRLVEANVQLAIATSQEKTALAHLRRTCGLKILN
jgi:outer membrane protein TolC